MEEARESPPPPAKNGRGKEADGTLFMTFLAVASQRGGEKFPASTQAHDAKPRQLFDVREVDTQCIFGNQGQLRVKAIGDMIIRVEASRVKGRANTLKDVLWVPGIPCRK